MAAVGAQRKGKRLIFRKEIYGKSMEHIREIYGKSMGTMGNMVIYGNYPPVNSHFAMDSRPFIDGLPITNCAFQ